MSALTDLQKQFGKELAQIANSPAFIAALDHLNAEKFARISVMQDVEIESTGKLILADLRGHLHLAHRLQTLHSERELEFGAGEDVAEYISPEQEAEAETKRKKRRK